LRFLNWRESNTMKQYRYCCSYPGESYEISYTEWGDKNNPRVIFCAHGLTRQSRDFDVIANTLQSTHRVICPDIVGRGESDWLKLSSNYVYSRYVQDSLQLIESLGVGCVEWIGTSMGGLIGMMLAAMPSSPIARLVINDIGPFIPLKPLLGIGEYVGQASDFDSLTESENYLRQIHSGFGDLTDAHWATITKHSVRRNDDGTYALKYDPLIRLAFKNIEADVDLWSIWQAVTQPVLVLRGEHSTLFERATAERMLLRDEATSLVEFPAVGHAPMLMDNHQISTVRQWLMSRNTDSI
jgi:pimeloyl-ACP methyl ester carboxylesterase